MANFKTHAAVGIMASGLLSTVAMAANIVPPEGLVPLALAGAVGSVLPDIDLQNSRASRAMFSGLGLFAAFCFLFNLSWKYSIAEMWIIWIGTYVAVRYVGHHIFHRYARHRGVFHSLLAATFFAFVAAAVSHQLLGADPTLSWMAGLFIFAGYLVHLTLDEIYSVDFHDQRVKRSFGTALKFFDAKAPICSTVMLCSVIATFFLTPTLEPLVGTLGSEAVWTTLNERLLPTGSWFGVFANMDQFAMGPLATPVQ